MTKLSNNLEYQNDCFPAAFAEFLLANNFRLQVKSTSLEFTLHSKKVVVNKDTIDLYSNKPEFPLQELRWSFVNSFTGLKHLDITGFILLMHLMGAVTLLNFLQNAKDTSNQHFVEADFIVNTLKQNLASIS